MIAAEGTDLSGLIAVACLVEPAPGDFVATEVTRLKTLTAQRKEAEFDMELSIGALTEELMVYPKDVVRTVCRDWARNSKWFPTLSDLIAECEHLMKLRIAIMRLTQAKHLSIERQT